MPKSFVISARAVKLVNLKIREKKKRNGSVKFKQMIRLIKTSCHVHKLTIGLFPPAARLYYMTIKSI